MSIVRFIRPDLASLAGYSAHKSPDTLSGVSAESISKLDANENPYGCSPRVLKALAERGRYNIYPDSAQRRLRQLLEEYAGVDASLIVAANGSGELLDDILCLLLEPGDEVINCIPTFDLYRLRTLIHRGRLVNISRNEDFSVNLDAIEVAITPRTKLIVLANPNNPTGNTTSTEHIVGLLKTGVPVLVDEAYYEFYGQTVAPLVRQYSNLMVLRTFSKWAGIAGLRMGYGLFPAEIVDYLLKIKLPYNVNAAALIAVEESLKDREYLMGRVEAIIAERERMLRELSKLTFLKPCPSQANFIFCAVLEGDAVKLQRELERRGILVRYFDQPLVRNGIRVSAGTPEQTDRLIQALREIQAKGVHKG